MYIEIDLEDYINRIPSSYLVEELISRDKKYINDFKEHALDFNSMVNYCSKGERQAIILNMLNLNQHCETDDIVNAIRELFAIKYIKNINLLEKNNH